MSYNSSFFVLFHIKRIDITYNPSTVHDTCVSLYHKQKHYQILSIIVSFLWQNIRVCMCDINIFHVHNEFIIKINIIKLNWTVFHPPPSVLACVIHEYIHFWIKKCVNVDVSKTIIWCCDNNNMIINEKWWCVMMF